MFTQEKKKHLLKWHAFNYLNTQKDGKNTKTLELFGKKEHIQTSCSEKSEILENAHVINKVKNDVNLPG